MEETKEAVKGKISKAVINFLISNIPIFSRLEDKELMMIEKYMTLVDITPGQIIFKEGDKGDYVCFVLDGSMDVLKRSRSVKLSIIAYTTG